MSLLARFWEWANQSILFKTEAGESLFILFVASVASLTGAVFGVFVLLYLLPVFKTAACA